MACILVVDDDSAIRNAILHVLRRQGHEVIEAINGREAVARYYEQPINIVITDIWMPDKDGLEVIRELRRVSPGLQVIAISGGSSRGKLDFLHHAEVFGANKILYKPFKLEELVEMVDELVENL